MNSLRLAAAFSILALLAACSRPTRAPPKPVDVESLPREPRSRSGNPQFYEVFGKRYFVLPSSAGYLERGVASWYGPGFHGKPTASGEKYDMHALTAAHKTLPLPCYVQVTNLENGRSIVVRVNDRGPFVGNRLIDLSHSAAQQLDIVTAGTGMVEVRTVGPPTAPPPVSARTSADRADPLYVQAGAFSDEANAERMLTKLRAAGLGPAFVRRDTVDGRTLYRVRVGPVPSVAEFDRLVEELNGAGIAGAQLALD